MKRVTYPEKTKFGDYYITKEGDAEVIRRMLELPDGSRKQERYPKKKYSTITSNKELKELVDRLNHRENRKKIQEIETKLAFLPTETMEAFRALLISEIPTEKDAKYHYKNLHRYFLKFFVDGLKLKDPIEWHKHQHRWGEALLFKLPKEHKDKNIFEREMSYKVIKGVINIANRFMLFLHERNSEEIPLIKFAPISNAMLKDYLAREEMESEEIGQFIVDADWKLIDRKIPNDIGNFVRLAYYYGLRRGESLGLQTSDVRNGYLSVERQIDKSNNDGEYTFKPLKDREKRKTPHWFGDKEIAYHLIKESSGKRIHPDTLGKKFSELMKSLNLSYELHDLRRTFITRALDVDKPRQVMLAVGHSNIETTMKYLRDDRIADDSVYKP